jgi:hypothetical protein
MRSEMAIRSVKIGISASIVALIACAVWFFVTDQSAKISQRAWHAQEEYVASQRAPTRGGSVAEMRRLAYAACTPKDLTPRTRPDPLAFFGGGGPVDAQMTTEECANNYIYGDGLMHASPFFFIREWTEALLQIVAISAAAGLVIAAIWKIVPLGLKAWWDWLRAD